MNDLLQIRTHVYPSAGAAVTTNLIDFHGGTGVVAVMNPAGPIEVVRMGIVVDSSVAFVSTNFVIAMEKYLKPGDATNKKTLGTITVAGNLVSGAVVYNDFSKLPATQTAEDGTTRNVAPRLENDLLALQSNDFLVLPGQQIVWDITDIADTGGKGQVFMEYIYRPFTGLDLKNATSVTKVLV